MYNYNPYYQTAYDTRQTNYMYPTSTGGAAPGTMMAPTQFPPSYPAGAQISPTGVVSPVTGAEESYIENILRLNLGKVATIYMTFENKETKVFTGRLEAAGRDHIIISEPQTGRRILLLMVYLDYITFTEELNYAYPFDATGQ